MTTATIKKFSTKEEAMEFSETQKEYWDLGFGLVYGPFSDGKTDKVWYEVNTIVEHIDFKPQLIDQAIIAINILYAYAEKVVDYELSKLVPLIGMKVLKADGALMKKHEYEKIPPSKGTKYGIHFDVHYWVEVTKYSYMLNFKCCINGGSYEVKPSTAFAHYEDVCIYLFEREDSVLTKQYNKDHLEFLKKRYRKEDVLSLATKAQDALTQYDNAVKDIPHPFRQVLGFKK